MNLKTLIVAASLATASTVAVADVTTANGDLVVVEKNQAGIGSLAALGAAGPIIFSALIVALAASGGS